MTILLQSVDYFILCAYHPHHDHDHDHHNHYHNHHHHGYAAYYYGHYYYLSSIHSSAATVCYKFAAVDIIINYHLAVSNVENIRVLSYISATCFLKLVLLGSWTRI